MHTWIFFDPKNSEDKSLATGADRIFSVYQNFFWEIKLRDAESELEL
eukprot:COSAG05_NODE_9013_length_654_cov_11.039640_2_plen_46_part_01